MLFEYGTHTSSHCSDAECQPTTPTDRQQFKKMKNDPPPRAAPERNTADAECRSENMKLYIMYVLEV